MTILKCIVLSLLLEFVSAYKTVSLSLTETVQEKMLNPSRVLRMKDTQDYNDDIDVYRKTRARLNMNGNLCLVEEEEFAFRPKKPEIKPLNLYRIYANRSCVGSDERPLMPSLRSQYVELGFEFKEILLNRDFDTSNEAYRRMLTGGAGGDEEKDQKELKEQTKRDSRVVWNKSCPLRRVRLHRGGYHIDGGYFVVSIYTVGINGRIHSTGTFFLCSSARVAQNTLHTKIQFRHTRTSIH